MTIPFRRAGLVTLLLCLTTTTLFAEEKVPGTLSVLDHLASPIQPATIEIALIKTGSQPETGLGGEPIELLVAGNVVATARTGANGRAILSYTPKAKGIVPFTVRVGAAATVAATEAAANMDVWERRSPIIVVDMTSLMEDPAGQGATVTWPGKEAEGRGALPDAADELAKVTQFYYNVLYVVRREQAPAFDSEVNEQARRWLKERKFPAGHILVLPSAAEAMGAKLDELHAAGWKTIKVGVGRTKAFAEAFLQRRLDAVMVPEPAKGEVPRKAKVAKEWKDVRKRL